MFGGKKAKILVVDDEPDVLQLIKSRLELNRYEVVTASNGDEGIERAAAEQPDVILLDVLMPEKNGYATCRELRDRPDTSGIPVIFLTAKGRKEDMVEGTWAGAVGYIVKPYDPKQLLETIEGALKKRRG